MPLASYSRKSVVTDDVIETGLHKCFSAAGDCRSAYGYSHVAFGVSNRVPAHKEAT